LAYKHYDTGNDLFRSLLVQMAVFMAAIVL